MKQVAGYQHEIWFQLDGFVHDFFEGVLEVLAAYV
jgi:hypothetical protein